MNSVYNAIMKTLAKLDEWSAESEERHGDIRLKKKVVEIRMTTFYKDKTIQSVRIFSKRELMVMRDPADYMMYVLGEMVIEMKRNTTEVVYDAVVNG